MVKGDEPIKGRRCGEMVLNKIGHNYLRPKKTKKILRRKLRNYETMADNILYCCLFYSTVWEWGTRTTWECGRSTLLGVWCVQSDQLLVRVHWSDRNRVRHQLGLLIEFLGCSGYLIPNWSELALGTFGLLRNNGQNKSESVIWRSKLTRAWESF